MLAHEHVNRICNTFQGSFTPRHTYSPSDVADVINFARLHGIRVIPEFDSPGHTYSWGKGLPGAALACFSFTIFALLLSVSLSDLLTPCWGEGEEGGPYVEEWGDHADMETVNPSQEYSYDVMRDLWSEVTQVFPDRFVHVGLDEAYYRCW